MLRKPSITSVPVEQTDLTPATEDEGKTDAEQTNVIINEVNEEQKADIEQFLFEGPSVAPEVPVVANAKTKRASRAKPKEPKEEPK